MSKMEQYIKKVEEFISKNKDLTEMEIIRYVYLDLGKRFSFNLNFAFGNSKWISKSSINTRIENSIKETEK